MSTSINGTTGIDVSAVSSSAITADRTSTDGTIVDLQKDGSTVGSIGTNTSRTYISSGSGQSGIKFNTGAIVPVLGADGTNNDAAYSLGASTARFTNLYLSGGVYLGGTGSANYLDDYEEGTWTPIFTGSGSAPSVTYLSQTGYYTKVGRFVFANGLISVSAVSGGSGFCLIGGLPFTSGTGVEIAGGQVGYTTCFSAQPEAVHVTTSATTVYLYYSSTHGGDMNSVISVSQLQSSGSFYFSVIYYTA